MVGCYSTYFSLQLEVCIGANNWLACDLLVATTHWWGELILFASFMWKNGTSINFGIWHDMWIFTSKISCIPHIINKWDGKISNLMHRSLCGSDYLVLETFRHFVYVWKVKNINGWSMESCLGNKELKPLTYFICGFLELNKENIDLIVRPPSWSKVVLVIFYVCLVKYGVWYVCMKLILLVMANHSFVMKNEFILEFAITFHIISLINL